MESYGCEPIHNVRRGRANRRTETIMKSAQEQAAQMLRHAYGGKVIAPMRDFLDPIDAAGAYAVQEINTRFWQEQGRRVVGRKAGLTAEAVQKQLGVDQPDFGVLFEDMRIANGGTLDPTRTIQPKAEAEIAFVLGDDLADPETTTEQVAAASLIAASQALELRNRIDDEELPQVTEILETMWQECQAEFPFLDEDRPLEADLRHFVLLIQQKRWDLYHG